MFKALYDWTLSWAGSRHSDKALGAMSFAESSFFPIPADVLFVPMCLARPDKIWRFALIATITSVLGGVFGWLIGHYLFDVMARPLLEFYGKMDAFDALKSATGTGTILLLLVTSGFSHLPPMKVVTILSGVVGFDLVLFVLSAIIARGGRFYLLAYLLKRYGQAAVEFLERRFSLAVGLILGLLAILWAVTKYL